ncbi:MAG: hypothetical protein ABIW84_05690, partial [Ilumatobacteraceae bacterium]
YSVDEMVVPSRTIRNVGRRAVSSIHSSIALIESKSSNGPRFSKRDARRPQMRDAKSSTSSTQRSNAARRSGETPLLACLAADTRGDSCSMSDQSNISDDDIQTDKPTEADDKRDMGGMGPKDTGDEPTEAEDDRDSGGSINADTGDA